MLYEAVLVGFAAIFIVGYITDRLFGYLDDPREPCRIHPKVPVIGHFLGLIRYGWDYYGIVSHKSDVEIYTIGILNFKVYVTQATRLTHLTQKTKTLSFDPFLQLASRVHGDISDNAYSHFEGDLLKQLNLRTKEALMPGPHLDAQNLRMGNQSLVEVEDILKQGGNELELFRWAKHAIVQATAAGLYGVQHPFRDTIVADAMWLWIEYRPRHMMGMDPLRTGYKARDKVFDAFRTYCQSIPNDASFIIRERQRLLRENGFSEDDTYKMQSTLSDAAYPNTVPTLFWTVYEIYSRTELLGMIRQELWTNAVTKSDNGFVLDVASLQTECPTLLSAYQETQRTRHAQVAFRGVTEDTFLEQYLLKKGKYLHMPAKPIHKNPDLWDQPENFDPHRFNPTKADGKARLSSSSFRAWGVPPHMCPARQFASTEILILVALLILRTDLSPVRGRWKQNLEVKVMEISTLPRPRNDVRLTVSEREDGRGSWSLGMGKGKMRISLASG